jgi:8-oxo-dGTP pyrophosphatase MutT (NUDIX family)
VKLLRHLGPATNLYHSVSGTQFKGVLIALACGDKVLCVQHSYQPQQWELVGGRLKKRHRHEPTLGILCEVRQELGHDLDPSRLIKLGAFTTQNGRSARTVYLFGYELTSRRRIRSHSLEIEKLTWLPMDTDQLGPGARLALQRLAAHRQQAVTAIR